MDVALTVFLVETRPMVLKAYVHMYSGYLLVVFIRVAGGGWRWRMADGGLRNTYGVRSARVAFRVTLRDAHYQGRA